MENNEILRQFLEIALDQQRQISNLGRSDLVLIGCLESSASPEAIAASAEAVRSVLYSVDVLTDKLQTLAAETRHR